MESIKELIQIISKSPKCKIFEPNSNLIINEDIPEDLKIFFELTNGVSLFEEEPFGMKIIGKEKFISTNKYLYPTDDPIWEELKDDITNDWFLIAESEELSQYISIDLTKENIGRCYDSFHETHGEEGMSEIVARSFTELLFNLYQSKGKIGWYWLDSNFQKLGDAFD